MKKGILIAALAAVTLGIGYVAFTRLAFTAWEEMLAGPFAGTNYTKDVQGEIISSLKVPGSAMLHVYRPAPDEDFVLCMQWASGTNAWCQSLIPELELTNGERLRGRIDNIDLKWVRRSQSGYKVYFSCDWNLGGRESGLIYLGNDLSFEGFALSW